MVKVIWTRRSLLDLEDIGEYIAKDSPKYAKITLEKIIKETDKLIENPLIGRIVPEMMDEKYRELIKGNYRIILFETILLYYVRQKKLYTNLQSKR